MIFQNVKIRGIFYQIILLLGVVAIFWYGQKNLVDNLAKRNIATGFAFLNQEASFDISETLISFTSADTYLRAFGVGVLNTINVALVGSIFAILFGLIIGIALLSKNWLLRNISYFYVNALRNTPLILQLFFWYMILTEFLPLPEKSNSYLGFHFTNRGIFTPFLQFYNSYYWILISLIFALLVIIILHFYAKKIQDRTGKIIPVLTIDLLIIFLAIIIPWVLTGFQFSIQFPEHGAFDIYFGKTYSPEFITILFGLIVYTSSFIAEVIRSGILAISKGQSEAGLSIGLSYGQLLRLVILPQAMRVIIPPLTNQVLNLFKNSTLAVAIGYPDLVSVANTTLNQTGQAIEAIILLMLFYLTGSLIVSLFMNWFNHKMRIIER